MIPLKDTMNDAHGELGRMYDHLTAPTGLGPIHRLCVISWLNSDLPLMVWVRRLQCFLSFSRV